MLSAKRNARGLNPVLICKKSGNRTVLPPGCFILLTYSLTVIDFGLASSALGTVKGLVLAHGHHSVAIHLSREPRETGE